MKRSKFGAGEVQIKSQEDGGVVFSVMVGSLAVLEESAACSMIFLKTMNRGEVLALGRNLVQMANEMPEGGADEAGND